MAPTEKWRRHEHVVVVGAGVIGLQTSLFLLEAGYSVTVVAQYFPGDQADTYTSPWAGGQWRSHAVPGQKQCDWDLQTLKYWTEIVEQENQNPDLPFEEQSGLGRYTSNVYWDDPSSSAELNAAKDKDPMNLWWARRVDDFAVLEPPFPSSATKVGITCTSFTFNAQKHIQWLYKRVITAGGNPIRVTLPTSDGLGHALSHAQDTVQSQLPEAAVPSVFVNATGLGARKLVPDDAVHPIRGQTLVVRGEADKISTHIFSSGGAGSDERIAYVLPRKGTGISIIGGSKQVGVWDTAEDPDLTRDIKSWARVLAPELCQSGSGGDLEVLKVQVGLRPGRTGGVRVEQEVVEGDGRRPFNIVHAYGNSGAGFQNSVGCARQVVELVGRFPKTTHINQ